MSYYTTLFAASLWSKFGFDDGDLFAKEAERFGVSSHELLFKLVKKHLLPKINGFAPKKEDRIKVVLWCTSHNPCRADSEEEGMPEWLPDISVTIAKHRVTKMAKKILEKV